MGASLSWDHIKKIFAIFSIMNSLTVASATKLWLLIKYS